MRRKARELAFRTVFEQTMGGAGFDEAWTHTIEEIRSSEPDAYEVLDAEAMIFAEQLARGYHEHSQEVDAVLERTIEGWSFGQMAKTDLSVLRLSAYEMIHEPTPFAPLIEVAVKIAKKYGGEDSGRFVNGVLARLKRKIDAGELRVVAKENG